MEELAKKQTLGNPGKKRRFGFLTLLGVFLMAGLLSACTSPDDSQAQQLVEEAYDCRYIAVSDFKKTDSLTGIYSYVQQYTFRLHFKEGEKGARQFFNGAMTRMKMQGSNWEAWVRQERVQDYIIDDCNEAGQIALERLTEIVLQQVYEKKKTVRMPLDVPMVGWAEYMPSRKGWEITVRRDRISGDPVYSKPVRREVLLAKTGKR
jgi:hypothetical protein